MQKVIARPIYYSKSILVQICRKLSNLSNNFLSGLPGPAPITPLIKSNWCCGFYLCAKTDCRGEASGEVGSPLTEMNGYWQAIKQQADSIEQGK